MDGGVCSWGVNPVMAIQECMRLGYKPEEVTMDIVMEE